MPKVMSGDVALYYEEAGEGTPILFLHEFLNDYSGWQDQMRHFSRGYRCISYSARGVPPSDIPDDAAAYRQEHFNADALALLDRLGIDRAHLVGLSMGAYTALQLALNHPERVLGVVAASGASGGLEATRAAYEAETLAAADQLETLEGMPGAAMVSGPTRIQLKRKDPIMWRRNADVISVRPLASAALTLRGVQVGRTPVCRLREALGAVKTPVLLMAGDEDEACLDVNLWLKRVMPSAQLAVFPGSGHVLNLEEPALFNQLTERFLTSVERGCWRPRDPSALPEQGIATALGFDSPER